MQLEVLGLVRESQATILSRLGGFFDIRLDDKQFEAVVNNNIFYRQDIELDPGTYTIELIVRDRLSGKIAAKRERLVLPVADAELSIARGRVAGWRYPGAPASDVLTAGGARVRPSPSREFRGTDNLIIFFELYNAAASAEAGKAQAQ